MGEEVVSADEAARRYKDAIRARGGARAWYDCGKKYPREGVKGVAECMKGLKIEITEEDWGDKYEKRYTGPR